MAVPVVSIIAVAITLVFTIIVIILLLLLYPVLMLEAQFPVEIILTLISIRIRVILSAYNIPILNDSVCSLIARSVPDGKINRSPRSLPASKKRGLQHNRNAL